MGSYDGYTSMIDALSAAIPAGTAGFGTDENVVPVSLRLRDLHGHPGLTIVITDTEGELSPWEHRIAGRTTGFYVEARVDDDLAGAPAGCASEDFIRTPQELVELVLRVLADAVKDPRLTR